MALRIREIDFEGAVPPLDTIVQRTSALSGLSVVLKDERSSDPALREMCGLIVFEDAPDHEVEFMVIPSTKAQASAVDLRCHVMSDPTLLNFMTVALESLGGRMLEPVADEFREDCARPIDLAELRRRHRRAERQGKTAFFLLLCLSPVLIPLMLIKLILILICTPFMIALALRRYRRHGIR